jgi:hypothetical protein
MLAYASRTDIAIRQLEKLSWDWIKMDCSGGKCYGLLAVSLFLYETWIELMIGSPILLRTCFVPFIALCSTYRGPNYKDKTCRHPEWVSLQALIPPDVE